MPGRTEKKAFGGGRPPSERPSKVCAVCGRPFSLAQKVGARLGERQILFGSLPDVGKTAGGPGAGAGA